MTRRIFGSAVVIAGLVGVMACSQGSKATSSSLTAPTPESAALVGNGSPGGKLVFSFNLIGTPGDYEGGCGDGRRIFVERDVTVNTSKSRTVTAGASCSAMRPSGTRRCSKATISGRYDVYARILGKPNGHLNVCANVLSDPDDPLCLLGTIDLTRGKNSKFQVQPDSLFNAELEDILWTVDTNKDYRIVQFRVYQTS